MSGDVYIVDDFGNWYVEEGNILYGGSAEGGSWGKDRIAGDSWSISPDGSFAWQDPYGYWYFVDAYGNWSSGDPEGRVCNGDAAVKFYCNDDSAGDGAAATVKKARDRQQQTEQTTTPKPKPTGLNSKDVLLFAVIGLGFVVMAKSK